jgi:UDP-N-acetylmuramoyl-L-alanyl-D-glutamate--2,6-diaminopimelate ligase
MKLNEILKDIKYNGIADNREITSITYDSRKIKENSLFIAISGEQDDGHDYILEAINSGATAVIANGRAPMTDLVPIMQVDNPRKVMSKIASNFYSNPSKKLKIIGITGTNGKTSTTQIVDHIIKFSRRSSSSLGTLGFNSPSGLITTGFTTPESIELQQILKTIHDGGIDYVPMEISSHAIELYRVHNIDVNYAIFTNLGYDHLDFHKTKENYFQSKLKLFKSLNKKSVAFLNYEDERTESIIQQIKCKYLTYGFNNKADLYIKNFNLGLDNSIATIVYNNTSFTINTNLIGKFNLLNISAAIICCIEIGISIQSITESIKYLNNIPGRLEKYNIGNNTVIIDYAHTPDAFKNIYENISILKDKNKKIVSLFGCGGNRDKTKRPLMAKIAEKYSDFIYLTNDNPRYENEDDILNDITTAFKTDKFMVIKNREIAINQLLANHKNSIILILGKGIEEYQIIGNKKIPHSDIKILKNYSYEN